VRRGAIAFRLPVSLAGLREDLMCKYREPWFTTPNFRVRRTQEPHVALVHIPCESRQLTASKEGSL
jgi:hypothetical protein